MASLAFACDQSEWCQPTSLEAEPAEPWTFDDRDAIARGMTARVARLLQLVPAGALLVVRWMRLDAPWSWMDELLGYSVYATNQFSSGMGIRESSALLVDWTGVDSDANSPETDVWAEVCARRIWSPGDLCLGDVLCLSRLRRRGQLLGVESPRPAPAPGASFAVIGSGPCREDGIQANSNRNDTDSDLKHIKVDQTEATWRRIILLYLCPASFPEQSP